MRLLICEAKKVSWGMRLAEGAEFSSAAITSPINAFSSPMGAEAI
jgi:hypothetical protein